MRIGLDIDNVITDMDKAILKEFIELDKTKRNKGIINPYARHIIKGMFDISQEEVHEFYANNMERIAKSMEPRKDAKKYMDKLLDDGHELYLISHRVYPDYKNPYETTVKWLKDNEINYTKLILSETTDKSPECKKYNIDIMFDDVVSNCMKLRSSGINVCLMGTKYNSLYRKDLPIVKEWNELYDKIKDMNGKKKVILDTDMFNEIDDQFALAYLMSSLDRFDVDAITIAPFSKSGYANVSSIEEGTQKSYDTTLEILDMINKSNYKTKVYKGATYYTHDSEKTNEAVDKIIEIALNNEKTTIIAIGAITNVALAIINEPKIVDRIEVIWLGGNSIILNQNQEFNFRQDINGVKTVFDSKVKLTVIPCRGVASHLITTSYELDHYLSKSEIGLYLCEYLKKIKKHYYKTELEEYGSSKTLWDISAIAYLINKDWFVTENISSPNVLANGCYELTKNKHEVTFVNDLFRNKIFNDYFIKMQKYNDKK